MFSRLLLVILSLLGFLSDFHVSGCDLNCPLKTTFNPPSLVVKYGDPFSVTCNLCSSCSNKVFNLEKSIGTIDVKERQIVWSVPNTTVWSMRPQCYYVSDRGQCCTRLPFTVYQPPDAVSIRFSNHLNMDPLYADREYIMECSVMKVAPIQNVTVTFFKGLTALGPKVRSWKNNIKLSDEVFKLPINISAEDLGAQFWCQAELELGPSGPSQPPIKASENYTAEVFYKPQILGPSLKMMTLTVGDPLLLNCSAVGNPSPKYNWTVPQAIAAKTNDSILSIQSVESEHEGRYTCTVTSIAGEATVDYDVVVKPNMIIYVVIAVVLAVVVLIVIAAGYRIWHKCTKQGMIDFLRQRTHKQVPSSDPL